MATFTSVDHVKALEHPTLKVPYELLNKKFRMAQRTLDKEVQQVQSQVKELEKGVIESNTAGVDGDIPPPQSVATVGQISDLLTGVVEKLSQLKRKAKECILDELEAVNCCKRRLEHLKEHDKDSSGAGSASNSRQPQQIKNTRGLTQSKEDWNKKRLDRMLVEHFLRCGYYDTAIKLAKQSDVEHLTNIDMFLVSREVEESLLNRNTAVCLNWCQENRSRLRKIKSTLEFNLRQQECIELIRQESRLEAIYHARKHFHNLEDYQQPELQKVMGLLAFKPDTTTEPYRSLFDPKRWFQLVRQFREDNFRLYNLSATSVFAMTLQCGLSALKTPHCYKKKRDDRNPDCPVCNNYLNQLAKPLPVAHCSQSKLICQLSGQPLNEHNQPLMLPNGNVYGENALKKMAEENDGQITCIRSKEVFNYSQLEKVFVMF